jgi:hypothetical protein
LQTIERDEYDTTKIDVRKMQELIKTPSLDQSIFDAPSLGGFEAPDKTQFEAWILGIGIVFAAGIISQGHDSAFWKRRGIGAGLIIPPEPVSTWKVSLSLQDSRDLVKPGGYDFPPKRFYNSSISIFFRNFSGSMTI